MAIGLEHLRGPNGEHWTGMSPPQQRSQYPQQKKSQAPQSPFGPQQTVQTSMGNFPTLQAYQQQQDAFVQQHLKNQSQYNQGLQSGQSPQRVPVMEAWKQAGENIQSGQYQGNPFQTGNVDAIMGMFNQYGIQAPQGFRDQLLQNLGQQSAPPMYQPQPRMYYHTDGEQMRYPGGPMQPQPAMGYPGGPMPPGQMPSNDGFIDTRGSGMGNWAVMVPYYNPATGETTHRTAGVVPAPGSGWVRGAGPSAGQQPPAAAPGYGARIRDPGGIFTSQVLDRDGDGIDDRNQLGPGQPLPTVYSPLPQMGYPGESMTPPSATQPNPSDPWSYPLRPGHTRGPSGEQIMTREAREAEIRRMEQESGRTYVRPKAGVTNGGWLPPAKPKPGASISLNPEQAAAMKQYMDSRQSGRAQPTPARTRGTPYRSGKK